MARYSASIEKAGAITAVTGATGATGASLCAVFPAASSDCKLTKIILGVTGTIPASSTNFTIGLSRLTANGTTPAGQSFIALDPNSAASTLGSTAFTTSWATPPTSPGPNQAAGVANSYIYRWSFNAQGFVIDFTDLPEELWALNNNGYLFSLLDTNLPSGTSISISVEEVE